MAEFGITRFGAYVPRSRIEPRVGAAPHAWVAPHLKGQAKGSRASMSWDEDAVAMAVEAGRDCIGNASTAGLAQIQLVSLNFPYADLRHAARVASALQLPQHVTALDLGYSHRVATSGLLAALRARLQTLFVAADNPTGKPGSVQELSYGAGAAALMLGDTDVVAGLLGADSVAAPFIDQFRATGKRTDYAWEERRGRDEGYAKIAPAAIAGALGAAGLAIGEIDHFVMPSLQRGAADAAAKRVCFVGKPAAGLENNVGYAGTAHPLLMLAHLLEIARPGERILLVGFGQGADALIFEVTEAIGTAKPKRGIAAIDILGLAA